MTSPGITLRPIKQISGEADFNEIFLDNVRVAPVNILGAEGESAPAYVASMSTGIPMWPALMLAEEGPLRFAAAGMQNASRDASRHHD